MLFVAIAGANFHFAGIDVEEASAMPALCHSAQNKGLEEQPQVLPSSDVPQSLNTFFLLLFPHDLYNFQFLYL